MADFLNFNGKIIAQSAAHVSPDNRSFRYGDGCFETMKMINKKIILQDLHFTRLFTSLHQLQFDVPEHFTPQILLGNVQLLVIANGIDNCRIRLTIFRGNGGLYDVENLEPNFIIQQFPLSHSHDHLNTDGWNAGIYRKAIKAADHFSSIKTNSFLNYALAALWAKKNNFDDAFLLNQFGRLADSTIANLFIISNGIIKTPALSEGCVAGVMRQHLLSELRKSNMPVHEGEVEIEEVLNASEVFVTNAIRGIQWVKQVEKSNYTNELTTILYHQFVQPLFKV